MEICLFEYEISFYISCMCFVDFFFFFICISMRLIQYMYMYHIVRCEIFLFPFTSLIPFFLYKVLIYS